MMCSGEAFAEGVLADAEAAPHRRLRTYDNLVVLPQPPR